MDGKIIFPTDNRKVACGLHVGQRVAVKNANTLGTIIGFGPAMHNGCTVKTRLDNVLGNMGNHHSCGNAWIEPL